MSMASPTLYGIDREAVEMPVIVGAAVSVTKVAPLVTVEPTFPPKSGPKSVPLIATVAMPSM